jgi:16S rRNA U1498 N3-methylase RsmE
MNNNNGQEKQNQNLLQKKKERHSPPSYISNESWVFNNQEFTAIPAVRKHQHDDPLQLIEKRKQQAYCAFLTAGEKEIESLLIILDKENLNI